MPLPVVTSTVFATWFGAETVFGISPTFVKDGLHGVAADPFGSSLCLILAGLLFARRLYRLNLMAAIGMIVGSLLPRRVPTPTHARGSLFSSHGSPEARRED